MNQSQIQAKEVHLLDYLNLIRKRKWILIACVFVSVVTAMIINRTIIPIYQATCQIIFDQDSNKAPLTGEDMGYVYYFESPYLEELNYNTQLKIITSHMVLKKVVNRLGLLEGDKNKNKKLAELIENTGFLSHFKDIIKKNIRGIEAFFKKLQGEKDQAEEVKQAKEGPLALAHFSEDLPDQKMSALVSALKDKISINPVEETRLVNITAKDNDPLWAAGIANAVAKGYIDYDETVRHQSSEKFIKWITGRIAETREKIRQSEKKFYDFRVENKLFSPEEKHSINTQKIGDLNVSYINASTKRLEIKAKTLKLENLIGRRKDRSLAIDITNDPRLKDININMLQEKIQLIDLKKKYKDQHPKVLGTVKRIKSLQQEFKDTLKKILDGLYFQDEILKTHEDLAQSAMAKVAEEAFGAGTIEFQYANLEHELETNKGLYVVLLNKLKETNVNVTMKKDNIRITEPARIPKSPLTTQKNRNTQLGLILGLMAGLGLIFLLEYIETGIKTEEDVKQYLQLPVMGIIPETFKTDKSSKYKRTKHKKAGGTKCPMINADNISAVFSEAYRGLRTNVVFSLNSMNGGSPCKSILITSSIPSEGKSTTAVNLALALAMSGERVLLIDSDLRIPTVYKQFDLDRKKGLTNILVDLFDTALTEGTLEEYGLGDIMNLISIQGKSGVLMVSDHSEEFQLTFKNGELVDTQWQNRPEEEKIGSILVTGRRITEEQKKKALRQQENCRQRLGSILLNMNLIKPEDLKGPLTLHFSSIINRIFSLRKGHFKFQGKFTQRADTLNYIKESFPSWQEAVSDQATPFLEKNIFSIIHNGPSENLKVLTSGPLPSNPSELLNSRRMKTLMRILGERFDYILLDSPPVNSVTDASILASLATGVIQVVYVGHSNRNVARKAKQQLDSVGAPTLGVVLNRLNLKKDGYYYYSYYHYYRYGYYYKTGDKKSKKEDKESPALSEKQNPVNPV